MAAACLEAGRPGKTAEWRGGRQAGGRERLHQVGAVVTETSRSSWEHEMFHAGVKRPRFLLTGRNKRRKPTVVELEPTTTDSLYSTLIWTRLHGNREQVRGRVRGTIWFGNVCNLKVVAFELLT